jgi:glycosyltransferase involved in cell wall biosynthesis
MDISVIVRFHNEERYLGAVLEALRSQSAADFEILAVDNCSKDRSRQIASRYADRILTIEHYQPGKALNGAIEQAKGDRIAVISAHAIPANADWLRTLCAGLDGDRVAGVYGGQLYPIHSRFLDKRDLDIFSALEPRVEREQSDFWNANSVFPRSAWEIRKFDESVYELEDHYWTKLLLPLGYEIHFEPAALVYHYSHLDRIDREYLPPSRLSDEERILRAIATLDSDDADWPALMRAGLTLSSLTRSPSIRQAVHALGRRLLTHWDFDVRWRMAQALGKIPDDFSVRYLVGALADRSFYPRDEAAWSLARLQHLAVRPLLRYLEYCDTETVPFVALSLGGSGDTSAEVEAVRALAGELRSGDPKRQRDAAYFAGEIAQASSCETLIPWLQGALAGTDGPLAAVCCWTLGCLARRFAEDIDWREILDLARSSPHLPVRFEATAALGKLALVAVGEDFSLALDALDEGLKSRDARVRYGAIQSLRLLVEAGKLTAMPEADGQWDDDFGVRFEWALLRQALSSRAVADPAAAKMGARHGI